MAEVLERKSTVRIRGRTLQPEPRVLREGRAGMKLLALAGAVIVVGNANAQVFTVRPSIYSRLTYSDNASATEGGGGDWVA